MKKISLLASLLLILFLFSSPVSAQQQAVDYPLPYPGILPDNFFYVFHAARDRIISLLISDPLTKAEFDLLQADKRLSAAVYLGNKKEYMLASETISKGENYLEYAITNTLDAKKQGKIVGSIVVNLYNSSLKHQEIIKSLENKTDGKLKASFKSEEERALELGKKANLILSAK